MGTVVEPKVTLVSWTSNPIKAIASQLLNMQGKMYHNIDEIDEDYAIELVRDLKRTALAGGLETKGDYATGNIIRIDAGQCQG